MTHCHICAFCLVAFHLGISYPAFALRLHCAAFFRQKVLVLLALLGAAATHSAVLRNNSCTTTLTEPHHRLQDVITLSTFYPHGSSATQHHQHHYTSRAAHHISYGAPGNMPLDMHLNVFVSALSIPLSLRRNYFLFFLSLFSLLLAAPGTGCVAPCPPLWNLFQTFCQTFFFLINKHGSVELFQLRIVVLFYCGREVGKRETSLEFAGCIHLLLFFFHEEIPLSGRDKHFCFLLKSLLSDANRAVLLCSKFEEKRQKKEKTFHFSHEFVLLLIS